MRKEIAMSYLKSLSLVLAALAAVASIAAVSASATVLCKVASASSCGVGNDYGAGTKVSSHLKTGTRAVIQNQFGEELFECRESTFDLNTTSTGGASQTVTADTETFSYGACSGSNTPVVLKKPSLVIHWTAGNNGTITESGLEITVGECIYGATGEQTVGPLTGGNPAEIDMAIILGRINGLICPAQVSWKGLYEVTAPSPLYVTAS
jgi:hypothetical protein